MKKIPFYVDKKIYYVNVEYKSIKNMYFKVKDDGMYVTANKRISDDEVKNFVSLHIEKFVKYMNKSKENKLYSVSDQFIYLFGKKIEFILLTGFTKKGLKKQGNKYYLNCKNGDDKEVETILKDTLKSELEKYLSKSFDKLENMMNLSGHKVRTTFKTTTWGTNSIRSKSISFSTRLAHYRESVIDYVIIHELAHTIEPNHSTSFWEIVEKHCPNYKKLRNELKSDKTILEE